MELLALIKAKVDGCEKLVRSLMPEVLKRFTALAWEARPSIRMPELAIDAKRLNPNAWFNDSIVCPVGFDCTHLNTLVSGIPLAVPLPAQLRHPVTKPVEAFTA